MCFPTFSIALCQFRLQQFSVFFLLLCIRMLVKSFNSVTWNHFNKTMVRFCTYPSLKMWIEKRATHVFFCFENSLRKHVRWFHSGMVGLKVPSQLLFGLQLEAFFMTVFRTGVTISDHKRGSAFKETTQLCSPYNTFLRNNNPRPMVTIF